MPLHHPSPAEYQRPAPRWPGLTPPGAERLRLAGDQDGVLSAAFSPDGTRVVTGLTLDDPLKHFRGTAIWIGDSPRPVTDLGTLGGKRR